MSLCEEPLGSLTTPRPCIINIPKAFSKKLALTELDKSGAQANSVVPNRPHCGKLINRVVDGKAPEYWQRLATPAPRARRNARQLGDLQWTAAAPVLPVVGDSGN